MKDVKFPCLMRMQSNIALFTDQHNGYIINRSPVLKTEINIILWKPFTGNITIPEVMSEQKYPCVMRSTISGVIVLFTKPREGTVLNNTNSYSIGEHNGSWDMDYFAPYEFPTGKNVTIEYPCVMKGRFGSIVLFSSSGHGVQLNNACGCSVGYKSDTWNMECFKPYYEETSVDR